jgi:hypothetical protein
MATFSVQYQRLQNGMEAAEKWSHELSSDSGSLAGIASTLDSAGTSVSQFSSYVLKESENIYSLQNRMGRLYDSLSDIQLRYKEYEKSVVEVIDGSDGINGNSSEKLLPLNYNNRAAAPKSSSDWVNLFLGTNSAYEHLPKYEQEFIDFYLGKIGLGETDKIRKVLKYVTTGKGVVGAVSAAGGFLGGIFLGSAGGKAVGKTLKLVTDKNSYLRKRAKQLEDKASQQLKDGKYIEGINTVAGETVETLSKGTVDVCCQMAAAYVDDVIPVSALNDYLETQTGVNPGKVFNQVTGKIGDAFSDTVDFEVDVMNAQVSCVKSAFKAAGDFFGNLWGGK